MNRENSRTNQEPEAVQAQCQPSIGDSLVRFYAEHLPRALNGFLCFDRAELMRRGRRLERVRSVLIGRARSALTDDEHRLLYAALLLCRAAEHYFACLITLKDSEGLKAWGQFVAAEERTLSAQQYHVLDGAESMVETLSDRLRQIANTCFPKPQYSSASYEIKAEECTICGKSSLDCTHEPGEFYDGSRCEFIVRDVTIRGANFVEEPKNKRAVTVQVSDGLTIYDRYRGTVERGSLGPADKTAQGKTQIRGVIASVTESNDPSDWVSVISGRCARE